MVTDIRCDFIGNATGHSCLKTERVGKLFLSNMIGWLTSLRGIRTESLQIGHPLAASRMRNLYKFPDVEVHCFMELLSDYRSKVDHISQEVSDL